MNFKCEKCNYTKCFLDTELNPHYCPILGKEIDGWQNIDKAYITLPHPSTPVTDWKKAFEMLSDLAIQDKDGRIRNIDTAVNVILCKCTEGGE